MAGPKKESTQDAHREQVRAALRYVRDHLDHKLSLRELAEIACSSPFHFHRAFKRLVGIGVDAHLKEFRFVTAAIDLRTTSRSIGEIALDSGYANHESFSRSFRRRFGMSPTQFRAQTLMNTLEIQIGLVKLPVTHFDESRIFYRDVLGLEEEFAVEAYGWAQYKTGNVALCLYVPGQGGGSSAPGQERDFHLQVSDAAKFFEEVVSRGGESVIAEGLVRSDDGGIFFTAQDPNGNTFKITQATNC